MAREPNWIAVQQPARGTSVKEQALHLMGQGIAPRFAGDFIRAIHTGLDLKGSPKQTRIDTLRAVADADQTSRQSFKRQAYSSIYFLDPNDKAAKAFLTQDVR